jgi:hypothetical protein
MPKRIPRPEPDTDLPPEEVLSHLSLEWLKQFESVARAKAPDQLKRLFSADSLVCGAGKMGPLDMLLSENFEFDIWMPGPLSAQTRPDRVKLRITPPFSMCVVPWRSVSRIIGGTVQVGYVTFCFEFQRYEKDPSKKAFVCYHAHFSIDLNKEQ